MFRIAICDDHVQICTEIETIIRDSEKLKSYDIEIDIFHSGESLLSYIERNHNFDLLLLDIELQLMNGVEVGRKIREDQKDEITQILYISSKQSYAMELFDNRPLSFLIKPIDKDKLIHLIERAINISNISCSHFEFKENGFIKQIMYKDIIYLSSKDKKIHMISIEGEKIFYGRLNVLYFDEINNNVIHESFIALDETRFSYSISERDIIEAKAFRYYRAIGISKIKTDDLIEHYNSHLKKIDIQIPKGKLRFGYLMES